MSAEPNLTAMSAGMHSEAPSVESGRMREVLGHFASGVVVVTAATQDGPVGFTCQSFSSLSLEPPLVSFAPARTSSTWPRIRAVGTFCVSVLAAQQAVISTTFARSGTDKFAGVAWEPAPSGAPKLLDVAAWIDCTLEQEFPGGDHTIVVGRVRQLGADASRGPLLFHRGAYGITSGI